MTSDNSRVIREEWHAVIGMYRGLFFIIISYHPWIVWPIYHHISSFDQSRLGIRDWLTETRPFADSCCSLSRLYCVLQFSYVKELIWVSSVMYFLFYQNLRFTSPLNQVKIKNPGTCSAMKSGCLEVYMVLKTEYTEYYWGCKESSC